MPRNKLRRKKSKSKTRAPVFSRKMFKNLEQLSGTRALVFNPPGETKALSRNNLTFTTCSAILNG